MSAKKLLGTHGKMREFLAMQMLGVKNGDTKIDEARTQVKLAEKVTENLYAEVKVLQFLVEQGRPAPNLGDLPIGSADPE